MGRDNERRERGGKSQSHRSRGEGQVEESPLNGEKGVLHFQQGVQVNWWWTPTEAALTVKRANN